MAEVTYKHGNNVVFVDYTPGSDVSSGQVVVVNDVPLIAHRDITANKLGALAVTGGVYTCTGDGAIGSGKKVYWDNTNNKVTTTSSGNKVFGLTVSACSGDGSTCDVLHMPVG